MSLVPRQHKIILVGKKLTRCNDVRKKMNYYLASVTRASSPKNDNNSSEKKLTRFDDGRKEN